jgi:CelD/BcsL family acetyltransferase involved in cellulose biosynthesis
LDVETVDNLVALGALESEWRDLEERAWHTDYYSTFNFVTAWAHAYVQSGTTELRVLAARQGGRLVGILPLSLNAKTHKGREQHMLRFAGHGDGMGVVLADSPPSDTICRALVDAIRKWDDWDGINLQYLPEASPLTRYLLRSHRSSLDHFAENPVIPLTGLRVRDGRLEGRMPSSVRKRRNKFLRECDADFHVRHGTEGDVLERMMGLHRAEKEYLMEHQGRTERHSWTEDPKRVELYRRLYAIPGQTVSFTYESPQGELLAVKSSFRDGGRLLSWAGAYHPSLARFSLGQVLQYDVLTHLVEQECPLDVYDLGAGGYSWKFEWTDVHEHRYRFHGSRKIFESTTDRKTQVEAAARPSVVSPSSPEQPVEKPQAPSPTDFSPEVTRPRRRRQWSWPRRSSRD